MASLIHFIPLRVEAPCLASVAFTQRKARTSDRQIFIRTRLPAHPWRIRQRQRRREVRSCRELVLPRPIGLVPRVLALPNLVLAPIGTVCRRAGQARDHGAAGQAVVLFRHDAMRSPASPSTSLLLSCQPGEAVDRGNIGPIFGDTKRRKSTHTLPQAPLWSARSPRYPLPGSCSSETALAPFLASQRRSAKGTPSTANQHPSQAT